jgi:hypothetical protein
MSFSSVVLTVSDDSSVDNSGQQSELVLSSVVCKQSSSILVTEREGGILCNGGADKSREGKGLELHDGQIVGNQRELDV